MRIIGCDLHARQQTIAMLDTDKGELLEKTLEHEGDELRKFNAALSGPVLVGIEATGSMQWFLERMEELGIECRVGHPAKIRKAETRKQEHDRRDGSQQRHHPPGPHGSDRTAHYRHETVVMVVVQDEQREFSGLPGRSRAGKSAICAPPCRLAQTPNSPAGNHLTLAALIKIIPAVESL